jgi:hypothetical protein
MENKVLKIITGTTIVTLCCNTLVAQNIGIGINPHANAKLDVNGRMRLKHTATAPATLYFEGAAAGGPIKAFIGTNGNDYTGIYGIGAGDWLLSMNVNNGNVGIGTSVPAFKLDVNGPIMIKSNSQTPDFPNNGIQFENTAGINSSYIGLKSNSLLGFRNTANNTWKLIFDLPNRRVGINTDAPTAVLDVNGNMRLRSSIPKAGSTITGLDVNGNAEWQDLVAFRTGGLLGGTNQNIPENTWTKVTFNSTPLYNYGLNYQPVLSEFLAGEQGLYSFSMQLSFATTHVMKQSHLRIMRLRNGITTELLRYNYFPRAWIRPGGGDNEGLESPTVNYETGNLLLQAGDKIWVEAWVSEAYTLSPVANATSAPILSDAKRTWFYGVLKARI